MSLNIIKGPRNVPVRAVVYGTPGIGKTSFCAGLPSPLFLDTEESSNQLDVARILITSWSALGAAVAELATSKHDYKTIVIDTVDWAERMLIEDLLRKKNMKSIEDFGFGKGYTLVGEEFGRFLTLCDGLVSKGLHVVFVAHSKVVRQSPPDQTDGFDRYEMKLSKQVKPLVLEWSELLIFANFQLQVVEGTDGKIKAQGGKERIMHTTNHAAWDAKNRFGLADPLPFDPKAVEAVFAGKVARVIEKPVTVEKPAGTAPKVISMDQLSTLQLYSANGTASAIIEKALAHYGTTLDLLTEEQAEKVIARCREEQAKQQPAEEPPAEPLTFLFPESDKEWLSKHETAVNTYLVSVKWITLGQTWRDLPPERGEKIVTKPDAFARAANIAGPSKERAA